MASAAAIIFLAKRGIWLLTVALTGLATGAESCCALAAAASKAIPATSPIHPMCLIGFVLPCRVAPKHTPESGQGVVDSGEWRGRRRPPVPSSQIFRQGFPVVGFPSAGEMFPQAVGEASMVENDFRVRALLLKLETSNRIHTLAPPSRSPCLDNSLVGQKLDVASRDVAVKTGKRATSFPADHRGSSILHVRKFGKLSELLGIRE